MNDIVQIAQARSSSGRGMERDCGVYGCDDRAVVVIEVGGGRARHTSVQSVRLCLGHMTLLLASFPVALFRGKPGETEGGK